LQNGNQRAARFLANRDGRDRVDAVRITVQPSTRTPNDREPPPALEAGGAEQTPGFDSRADSRQAAGTPAVSGNRSGRRSVSPAASIRVRSFDIAPSPTELFGIGAGVLDHGAGCAPR